MWCMYTYLLLLISMVWHRQAIFESKGDKLSSSSECRIRSRKSGTESPAYWMPDDKPTDPSSIKLKTLELNNIYICIHTLHRYFKGWWFPSMRKVSLLARNGRNTRPKAAHAYINLTESAVTVPANVLAPNCAWISNYMHYKVWDEILIHSWT